MTWRVVLEDWSTDNSPIRTIIATGLPGRRAARNRIEREVSDFLGAGSPNKYAGDRWELRWQPKRGMAYFICRSTHEVCVWRHEEE